MIKTIALDIGNVCVNIKMKNCLRLLGLNQNTDLPPDLLNATDSMERGILSEDDWLKSFIKASNGKFEAATLKKAYNAIIGSEICETCEFVKNATKNGYKIVFFSDTSQIHLNHVFANLSFANLISGGIYSFEVGVKKPESLMFEEFESHYGTPSLYLDDKKENIKAGLSAGWPSLLFQAKKMSSQTLLAAIE